MLALSPLFSTTYAWSSDDLILNNILLDGVNDICIEPEASSYKSFLDFDTHDDIPHEFATENSNSSGRLVNGDFSDPMMVVKKLNHNASERHRRKKVNDLYAFLRSLLPNSRDQKKKVSIPGTVSRALKYIPELQKEVETLIRKKEKLSSYSSSKAYLRGEDIENKFVKDVKLETKSSVDYSVSVLGTKEAVIQLISSNDHMRKKKDIDLLSKFLNYLEEEEDDFILLNSTTFKCLGEGMSLSTLHIQVEGDNNIDAERLKEKLLFIHQQLDRVVL